MNDAYEINHMVHLNARRLKKSFSVIGISETWLTDCTAELVHWIQFCPKPSQIQNSGGVGIYLQNDY